MKEYINGVLVGGQEMTEKPKARNLEKGSPYLQYDRGYNHAHDDWERWLNAKEEEDEFKKFQPCGCVLCTCKTEERCLGCGAKTCEDYNTDKHPSYVKKNRRQQVDVERIADIIADHFGLAKVHPKNDIYKEDYAGMMEKTINWHMTHGLAAAIAKEINHE